MKKNNQSHIFSLFWPETFSIKAHQKEIIISQKDIIKRMYTVLRLQVGETCIVFDHTHHAEIIITSIQASSLTGTINSIKKNIIYHPHLTVLLPYLKKEALEEAIYTLTTLGINQLILYHAEKSHAHTKIIAQERLEKIMLAACEQSKNYAGINLRHFKNLSALFLQLSDKNLQKFLCNQYAQQSLINSLKTADSSKEILIAIGPEGDFTDQEKKLFVSHGFQSVVLTPTVLRSQDAAFLAAGIVRNYFFMQP